LKPQIDELEVGTRRAWRRWLERHHASSPGVWLVFQKGHTGVASIPYDDAVREALCFGWIDSLIKRLDDDRYARKFTPRKPGSRWSESNRKRWAELEAEGALAPAGRAADPTGAPSAVRPGIPDVPELPVYIARALERNRPAWRFFQDLAPRERQRFVHWIHTAKRPETRERRVRDSIALLANGRKLGLK
jgi:uncharacterized protein YdeI (YjbR/CyaY-like superfamily)